MASLTKTQFDVVIKKLKSNGELTTSGILAEAKKKTSPLHCLFEWDDSKAANEYRLMQARQIIKRANASISDPKETIVHVPISKGKGEGCYKEAQSIVNTISDFELALSEALKDLHAAQRTVSVLTEVAEKESPDKAAILGIALKGLETCNEALHKLH